MRVGVCTCTLKSFYQPTWNPPRPYILHALLLCMWEPGNEATCDTYKEGRGSCAVHASSMQPQQDCFQQSITMYTDTCNTAKCYYALISGLIILTIKKLFFSSATSTLPYWRGFRRSCLREAKAEVWRLALAILSSAVLTRLLHSCTQTIARWVSERLASGGVEVQLTVTHCRSAC